MSDFASWIGSGLGDVGSAIGSGISDIGSAIGTGLSDVGSWLGLTGGSGSAQAAGTPAQAAGNASLGSAAPAAAGTGGGLWGDIGSGLSGIGNWLGLTSDASPLGTAASSAGQPSDAFAQSLLGYGGGGNATSLPLSITGTASPLASIAAGGGGTTAGGILSDLPSLKSLAPFLGLGLSALMRPSMPSGVGQAAGTAAQQQAMAGTASADAAGLTSQAQSLINSASTGQLPPGGQAVLDQAEAAAKAQTASQFAGLGLTGSTSEGSALSSIDLARAAQQYSMAQSAAGTGLSVQQVANQMLSSALGALGSAGQTYSGIGQIQLAQDSALANSLANFSAAAAGASGYRNQVPGATA